METPLIVTDFLEQAREHYGDEEASWVDGDRFTYAEFGERADRFAAGSRPAGIERATASPSLIRTRTTTLRRPSAR